MDKRPSMGKRLLVIAIAATLTLLAFGTTTTTHAQEIPHINHINSQENVTGIQNSSAIGNTGEEDDKGVPEEGSGEDADEPGDVDVGDDED